MEIKQAVIFCGGIGERLKPITDNIPKPMVDVNGKPFLEHLINQLKANGIFDIVLLTGYKKEVIEDYFGDGLRFGINIKYSRGPVEWLTAKRLWEARDLIDDYFLLMYADNYVHFNLKKSTLFHLNKNNILSFVVFSKLLNNNLMMNSDNNIIHYDETRQADNLKYVELGYMIVNKKGILEVMDGSNVSFNEIIKRLVEKKEVVGLETKYKYHSISDMERLEKMKHYLANKKIILIDRDGVINKNPGKGQYILRKDDLILLEDSIKAMRKLSDNGFSFIIITNQACIGKGLVTQKEIDDIHSHLLEKLKENGINILDIFYCPHDINEGCECRKPNPGMIIEACNRYSIVPSNTIFIGDDDRDCLTAFRADVKSILIGEDYNLSLNLKYHKTYVEPDFSSKNLSDTVDFIIRFFDDVK
jgi:D-glycero-D-manno-heptose 1,7-bisphosphate phosphatase